MTQTIVQVDAFTDRAFAGNPAAVCVLHSPRDEQWMQDVAREMNLSETAFLQREGDTFQLRWFSPTIEIDLCGHATLASAHVLWEDGHLAPDEEARFRTRSGQLVARREGDRITMDFPADPPHVTDAPAALMEALAVRASYVGRGRFDYLVEVESEDVVRRLRPNMSELERVTTRGVIVTARSNDPGLDFVSRFFAPAAGVPEDPVTGSAHCCLGPYWRDRLGKNELTGYQASARGGTVGVRCLDARVLLSGHAVTVLRAELLGV
jgi:PhzF family phenazine biosynthesis protein